jgi:hypothetical protein
MRKIRDTVTVADSRQLLSQGLGAYLRRDGKMLVYARRVGRNYVLYPQGTHGALITAGQDNGQGSGRDVGQNDTSQGKEPDAYTL